MKWNKSGVDVKKKLCKLLILGMTACVSWTPPLSAAGITSLDGDGWRLDGEPVTVPHTWNAEDYDRGFVDGVKGDPRRKVDPGNSVMRCATLMKIATYTRALPAPKDGRRYFVRFDGVCEKAVVRVNGRFAGRHVGAFTPFTFEVTPFLLPGGYNQLEVEVDNRYDPEIPPASADFSLCGGIYRPVKLIETGLRGIDPTRPVRLWPNAADGTVRAEIPAMDGPYVTKTYSCGPVELWTPERPKLYEVEIEMDGERQTHRVGFKTVDFRADGFYLNGVKRRVKGINRHQDEAGKGWALAPADEERDIRMIKEMGCDAVRLCHYPQSENIYRLCDELGLLVWSEIPNVDYLTLTETYRRNALEMAREMIAWRGNHVSVAWWGAFNELYSSGPFKGEQPFRPGASALAVYDPSIAILCREMKTLDPTRPIVAAACRRTLASINAIPDQIGFNIYPSWYGTEKMSEWIEIFLKNNPKYTTFAMSEFGAGGAIEQHQNPVRPLDRARERDHSEEYMTEVHVSDWRQMAKDDRLWGAFIWVFNDFGASDRYEGVRAGVNDKGVVSADRKTKKDVYYFYKANWNPEPMLHLCSTRMTETTNNVCDVVAFSNLDGPVRFSVNGEMKGEARVDEAHAVKFPAVPLVIGENVIRVTSGGLSETWNLRRVR